MKRLIFCLAIFAYTTYGFNQNKSILYIGNSYTASNNLPLLVYNLALSNEDTITYDSNTPGGARFEQHKTNPTTLTKINSKAWDFVVLQDQSQIPALPEELMGEYYSPPNASELNTIIKDNSICTEVVFFMTWGRKYGDASFCEEYPPVCTSEGMQDELSAAYISMAEDNDATVAPAGEAWRAVINDDPEIELYTGDGSHPNINGSYLTACVMYATMYQKSVTGNTFISDLDADLALYLQEMADEIVFGDLETWRIGNNDLTAGFTYETEDLTCTFTNTGNNGTSWNWLIDGTMYEVENPIHEFPADGFYDVTYTISNECETLTITEEVAIGVANINTQTPIQLDVFPNPAGDYITISTNTTEAVNYQLFTVQGKLIQENQLAPHQAFLLHNYEPGIYLLRVNGQTIRFVKR